jgi:hypothetical protein
MHIDNTGDIGANLILGGQVERAYDFLVPLIPENNWMAEEALAVRGVENDGKGLGVVLAARGANKRVQSAAEKRIVGAH